MRRIIARFLIFGVVALFPITNLGGTVAVTQNPRVKGKLGTSLNWSGYAVETNLVSPQNNVFSDVKAQWTVPTVTDSTAYGYPYTYSSTWVGIDGYSDNTVEQIGTEQDFVNGTAVYYAWYEMYPKFPVVISSVPISPGNTISAEVQYVGKKSFVLTLNNVTTNQSFTSPPLKAPSAKRQSAEWIEEAPFSGGILPLANFGTVTFSSASANGLAIDNPAWQKDAITMVASNGTVKAQPSGLTSTGGTSSSFSIQWKSN